MAARVADAPDNGVHFIYDLSVTRLIGAEGWGERMLLVHEFVLSIRRIGAVTVQLRHLGCDELERKFIRLPCFDVERSRSFGLDDAMAMEELDFVVVGMAEVGFDVDLRGAAKVNGNRRQSV